MDAELLAEIPEHLRERVSAAFQAMERRNAQIWEVVRRFLHDRYGPASERLSAKQLDLLELEPGVSGKEVEAEALRPPLPKESEAGPAKVVRPLRAPLPAHLPREERIIALPQSECQCAQCGALKKLIGYEQSERLSIKPIEFFIEVTKREKKACARCEEMGVQVAPVPPCIIEKGILSDKLVVDVIVRKYLEHNPLYRQAVGMRRDAGVEVSESTLGSSVLKAGALLAAVCAPIRADLLAGAYIQADETTVPVQSPRAKGKNHQAYFWEYGRPGGPVFYEFRMGREREGPKNFLLKYEGRLQTDGYAAYDQIGGAKIAHFGCWAHARRKFFEASKADPKDLTSVTILGAIARLYAVERQAREAGLDSAAREALRLEVSVPILAEIQALILKARASALPKGALGKAFAYGLSQWPRLERYAAAGHGCVEIDNNIAENGMRGIALGRKNWIHLGSEEAGPKVSAILTILETCKRLKINAREYLEDVLPRLAGWNSSRIAELTPMAWQRARQKAAV